LLFDKDIRRGRQAIWACHARLVFVTKYRRGVFTNAMLIICEQTMREILLRPSAY
jgi:putative transposase